MTPEEILKDLRDIHVPEGAGGGPPTDFAIEPFLVLGALLVCLAVVRWLRYRHWRSQARARLAKIEREGDILQSWQGLVDLVRQVSPLAGHPSPPKAVFLPPDRVGPAEIAAVHRHIRAMILR